MSSFITILSNLAALEQPPTAMSTTPSHNSFQYQSRLDSTWLRLLQPLTISQKVLSFKVIQVPRAAAANYSAVSYTWGDQPPSEVILLDGQVFHVRPNLWSCLYYLGLSHRASGISFFWVDAICINQNDDVEKTAQVRMMDQIYRGAALVSVWLGLVTLPDHVSVICNDGPIKTLETDSFDLQDSLADLSNRPYWSRVWVIQEFLLARRIQLHCSNWAFNVDDFKDILFREVGIDQFSDDPLPMVSRGSQSGPNTHAALPLTYGRHIDKHPEFLQPLYHLLIEHRRSQCSDPRDKVFGLLGLVTVDERRLLELYFPNYELSEEDVLIITLAHLTQYGPLVTSLRDQDPITSQSTDLFEALGVRSLAKRERLLRRASELDYIGRMSGIQRSQMLELHDVLERYGIDLESGQEASATYSWFSMESWSKTAKGAAILLTIGTISMLSSTLQTPLRRIREDVVHKPGSITAAHIALGSTGSIELNITVYEYESKPVRFGSIQPHAGDKPYLNDAPSSDRQVIGPDFQAFSVETASWFDYTGNSTHDNVLNTNLVQNIRDIGKVAIHVRIGGSSGNTVTYDPSQAIGMNTTYLPSNCR
ncbi:hypothetical protein E8E14_012259 [Neopestalotiopsis sp. 37M]|nr:hypothetical protein E8E14_012259 [Neopestalotiopsis sp. 37M]